MQKLQTLDQKDLLETLTDSYREYKKIIKEGGSEVELNSCRETLLAAISELNNRSQSVVFCISSTQIAKARLSLISNLS